MKQKLPQLFGTIFLIVSLFVGVFLALQKTSFFNRASGVNADLVIDFLQVIPNQGQSWRNLAQGGEEKNDMLSSVIPPVSELKPQYIRIDHIFDLYTNVSKDASGQINVDWALLDQTINSIRAIGATPFISLSYFPGSITKNGQIDSIPENYGDWESLVQQTVEHVSGRGGLNISNVYYEVWNEPDLFGGFKIGGKKNYLDLYSRTYNGVIRAKNANPYKIGGPASTDLYENWYKQLIEFTRANNMRLDFFSWHKYSKNLADYESDLEKIRNWNNDIGFDGSNLELLITESGPNSKNDKVYDNSFGAIHQIAVSSVLNGKVQRNFAFEIKDGPGSEKYWGRWGILTNDKFGKPEIKPRYNAFKFLNRMAGEDVLVSGQGSWVKAFAKKSDDIYRVLLVNYDPQGTHGEQTPVKINNIPYKNFILKRYDFLGGTSESVSETDASGTWSVVMTLRPNTAFILEISPI